MLRGLDGHEGEVRRPVGGHVSERGALDGGRRRRDCDWLPGPRDSHFPAFVLSPAHANLSRAHFPTAPPRHSKKLILPV